MSTQGTSADNQVRLLLAIGEIGKLVDLSTKPQIVDKISSFFKAQSDKVRTAASICLGNLTIGNTDFFLGKVFGLLSSADQQDTQLFMNTIREIIIHDPKCLESYLVKLIPLLLIPQH